MYFLLVGFSFIIERFYEATNLRMFKTNTFKNKNKLGNATFCH